MALAVYSDLKTALANWLHRSDLTSLIPDFITLGEIRINRELRVRSMESSGTLQTVAGTATVALPTNFRQFRWLYIDGQPKQALEYLSGEALHRSAAGNSDDKPKYYTLEGGNLRLGPIPDAVYDIKYLAYIAATALSDSQTTNTLFPRYADLYLFAALTEAFSYVDDVPDATKFDAMYRRSLERAQTEDVGDRFGGSTLIGRVGHGGVP